MSTSDSDDETNSNLSETEETTEESSTNESSGQDEEEEEETEKRDPLLVYFDRLKTESLRSGVDKLAHISTLRDTDNSSIVNESTLSEPIVHISSLAKHEVDSLLKACNEKRALETQLSAKNDMTKISDLTAQEKEALLLSKKQRDYYEPNVQQQRKKKSSAISHYDTLTKEEKMKFSSMKDKTSDFVDISNYTLEEKLALSERAKASSLSANKIENSNLQWHCYYDNSHYPRDEWKTSPVHQMTGRPSNNNRKLFCGKVELTNNPEDLYLRKALGLQSVVMPSVSLNTKASGSGLEDINTLSFEKQQAILNNTLKMKNSDVSQKSNTFFVNDSVQHRKREFEALNASTFMNSSVHSIYHGLSSPSLNHCDSSSSSLSGKKSDAAVVGFTSESLQQFMKRRYPHFCDAMKNTKEKELLCSLINSMQLNYIIVVPSKDMLARYKDKGMIGYLVVVLRKNDDIPADRRLYNAMTLMKMRRNVRRLTKDVILIDNLSRAELDKDSKGHVYVMKDEPRVMELTGGAEKKKVKALPSNQPQIIEKLPKNESSDLDLIEIPESPVIQRQNEAVDSLLVAVHKNTNYATDRRLENLTSKMLSPAYRGASDMASFIDNSRSFTLASTSAISTATAAANTKQKSLLFLKLYSYEGVYKQYQNTHLSQQEKLTLENQYAIEASQNYTLDKNSIRLTEYELKSEKIQRSSLVNHLAVLAFQSENGKNYALTSFMLSDDSAASSVYMTKNENVFLNFKDNILHSIVLNQASPAFLSCPRCGRHQLDSEPDAYEVDGEMEREMEAEEAEELNNPDYFSQPQWIVNESHPLLTNTFAIASFDKETCELLYQKDLKFDQFLQIALPVSAPSIFDQIRAGTTSLFKTEKFLIPMRQPLDVSNYKLYEKKDKTMKLAIGFGASSVQIGKTTKGYRFQKRYWQKKKSQSDYIIQYVRAEDDEAFNFKSLASEKGTPLTVNITLDDLVTKTSRSVLFKLKNSAPLKKDGIDDNDFWYKTEADTKSGITYYFQLTSTWDLTAIFIQFKSTKNIDQLRSKVDSASSSLLGAHKKSYSDDDDYDEEERTAKDVFIENFAETLGKEGFQCLSKGVSDQGSVRIRMSSFVVNWRTKLGSQCNIDNVIRFFERLQKEIASFRLNALDSLTEKIDFDIDEAKVKDIFGGKYLSPSRQDIDKFVELMNSQFECKPGEKKMISKNALVSTDYQELVALLPEKYRTQLSSKNQYNEFFDRIVLVVNTIVEQLKKSTSV
jgi:hypothetical protein